MLGTSLPTGRGLQQVDLYQRDRRALSRASKGAGKSAHKCLAEAHYVLFIDQKLTHAAIDHMVY